MKRIRNFWALRSMITEYCAHDESSRETRVALDIELIEWEETNKNELVFEKSSRNI